MERNFARWLYSMHIWMTSFSSASVWPVATVSPEPSGRFTELCLWRAGVLDAWEVCLDDSVEEEPSGRGMKHRDGGRQVVLDYIVICSLLHEGETFSLSHQQNRLQSDPWFLGWEVKTQGTMPFMTLVPLVKRLEKCIYSGLLPHTEKLSFS